MEDFKLSDEDRERIASVLMREIDASSVAKGELPSRWKRCEDIYHLVPGTCRLQAVEGMESYEIPLARPKITRVVGTVVDTLTGLYPFVQCLVPEDQDGDPSNDENTEKLLHELAKSGGFIPAFKKAVLYAALTNLGILRITPNADRGCKFEWIHPDRIIVYPAEFGTFAEAKTVGHYETKMLYQVQELQDADYYDKSVDIVADAQFTDQHKEARQRFEKTQPTSAVEKEDGPVRLAHLLHKCKLKGDETYQYYSVTYAVKQRKILRFEPYKYGSVVNYFDVRFEDTEGEIYTGDSVMQSLQGLQLLYSDLFTMLIQGLMATAFPTIYESGGTGPLKTSHYGPGLRVQSPTKLEVQVVNASMNPSVIPLVLEKIEEQASGVVGISQLGTAENMPSGTTATAAAGFLQAQQAAKDEYSQSIAPVLARMWEFLWLIYKEHYDDINAILGSRVVPVDPEELEKELIFEVTGESGASNPQALLNKLMFLKQLAADPNSDLDSQKIDARIVQMLDLPFATTGLQKDGPGRQEMMAIIAGLLTGHIAPEEAMQMLGLTPETLNQLSMQMETNEGQQGPNQPPSGEPGMGGAPAIPSGPNSGPPAQSGNPPPAPGA